MAESQESYGESRQNYQVAEDGVTQQGYTFYGAAYGVAYGDWNALFVDWALQQAGVPGFHLGERADTWLETLLERDSNLGTAWIRYNDSREGDLVFVRPENAPEGAGRVGIIRTRTDEGIYVCEGDLEERVAITYYALNDPQIAAFAALPGGEEAGKEMQPETLTGAPEENLPAAEPPEETAPEALPAPSEAPVETVIEDAAPEVPGARTAFHNWSESGWESIPNVLSIYVDTKTVPTQVQNKTDYVIQHTDAEWEAILGSSYYYSVKMFYVEIENQMIPTTPQNNQNITVNSTRLTVRAKADFAGGNDILTNGNAVEPGTNPALDLSNNPIPGFDYQSDRKGVTTLTLPYYYLENPGKGIVKNEPPAYADLTLKKIDRITGEQISGARFSLKQGAVYADLTQLTIVNLDDSGEPTATPATIETIHSTSPAADIPVIVVPENGVMISRLTPGDYTLKEEAAPAGYIITGGDIPFTVEDGTVLGDENHVFTVENEPGAELPSTVGPGPGQLMLLGALLLTGAALLLWKNRRLHMPGA